ncbi:hypothetical protein DOTSEDRAFT_67780 [Dothistroma septosporum NZE10]|uniref:Uncharacterized protein n=1 Tax=Dothistroma septosporum (strain NZE10 / CBS 128990) TaxID=675120 RepID=N1Q2X1_DOTSN|nr:hypothetical protein DOTSEDRAFT_67780 [Dothistroma septosporum NZE10]
MAVEGQTEGKPCGHGSGLRSVLSPCWLQCEQSIPSVHLITSPQDASDTQQWYRPDVREPVNRSSRVALWPISSSLTAIFTRPSCRLPRQCFMSLGRVISLLSAKRQSRLGFVIEVAVGMPSSAAGAMLAMIYLQPRISPLNTLRCLSGTFLMVSHSVLTLLIVSISCTPNDTTPTMPAASSARCLVCAKVGRRGSPPCTDLARSTMIPMHCHDAMQARSLAAPSMLCNVKHWQQAVDHFGLDGGQVDRHNIRMLFKHLSYSLMHHFQCQSLLATNDRVCQNRGSA